MDQNAAAISALREYAKIDKPGYAFMIEAPWGAGKTHLVNREFKALLSSDRARYITLNGVSDYKTFRRALLAKASDAKLTAAAGKFGDALGKIANIGNIGTLAQDVIEDWMVDNLPDLLIFDDVERCEMKAAEKLGLINDFVEHKSKKVVLCAFTERDDEQDAVRSRDDFLSRKEKVVGRTVRIVADASSAMPDFISAMPDGQGKQWFHSNIELVLDVFREAAHNNLRVLRQCLRDCGRVIDELEEDLFASKDAMIRFVRTYLTLAMALATGEINPGHLGDRSDHGWLSKPIEGQETHPLYKCFKRHPQAEIFAGNAASILPVDLGVSLIGIGYEEPDKINEKLRSTGQFSGEPDVPLWRRFVEWRKMPTEELENTYQEALSYIFEQSEIESGPYLHVAHDLISISKDGPASGEETAKRIEDRIQTLAKSGNIPAADFGRNLGWSIEGGMYSFGGYEFDPDEHTKPIIESMAKAQIAAYDNLRSEEAKRLMNLLNKDYEAFGREFSWGSGRVAYQETAILHEIDPNEFSAAVFKYVTSGDFVAIGTLLKTLAERHRAMSLPEELVWANKVKTTLINLAEEAGPLEKARMASFLAFNWKFPTGDT